MENSLSLRSFTTMKIGGSAEKIIFSRDLTEEIFLPRPIRILGNGSNILIDDQGLKGSVIIVRDQETLLPEILREDSETVWIRVSAGLYLPTLAHWAAKQNLSGCEYMVGIPGTAGGALVQNAGAHEQDLSMILESASLFDHETKSRGEWTAEHFHLDYRHSVLKSRPNLIVRDLTLRLEKSDAVAIKERMQNNLVYRKTKTPMTKASLGSIYTRIPQGDSWIYPGKLIEDAGLKGLRRGGAMVSEIHANYIVNEGHATFDDVIFLMHEIERRVFEKSGVTLRREILVWSDRG